MTYPIVDPVLSEIAAERKRQTEKWGEQNHLDGTARPFDTFVASRAKELCQSNTPETDNWRDILDEEVTEAYAESDPARIREELIQIAAVAVAWVEAIDRR